MADEFSTPVSSLGIESTRTGNGKDPVKPQSYEELVRQQSEPEEPVQKKVRFRDPPADEYDDRYFDTSRPTHEYMTGPPAPHWAHQQYPYPSPPMQPMHVQESTEPVKDDAKPWWKVWITQNKIGVISALVIFALLYFVYPRISSLERFMGQRLPTSILAGMSILAASGVTAINMAI